MMKIVFRSGLFVAIFFVLLSGLYALGGDNPKFKAYKNKVRIGLEGRWNTIILGSSHAGAIRPCEAGFNKCKYFNRGGSDLFEACYQGVEFINKADIETVFMSISYFSFNYDNDYEDKKGERPRREKRILLYASYPGLRLIRKDYDNLIIGKLSPFIRDDYWAGPILSLYNLALNGFFLPIAKADTLTKSKGKKLPPYLQDRKQIIAYINSLRAYSELESSTKDNHQLLPAKKTLDKLRRHLLKGRYRSYVQKLNGMDLFQRSPEELYLDIHGKKRAANVHRTLKDMSIGNSELISDSYEVLVKFIKAAKRKGVRVVFVTTPVWPSYTKAFPVEYKNTMKTMMAKLVYEHNIEYLNFSESPEFVSKGLYFTNADHLNEAGAKRLSKILRKSLNRIDG
jgi:hypothetical protein